MFERRQRAASALNFNHVQRGLMSGERIPSVPGLIDQIQACRHDMARKRREPVDAELEPAIDDDDDDDGEF